MIVVADTSPLHYLVLIDTIDVLPVLFSDIIVPEVVIHELRQPRTPAPVVEWARRLPAWVRVELVDAPAPDPSLHPGEAAAIALATRLKADRILVDDRAAREYATRHGIPVVGTLGVIELAARRNLIDLRLGLSRLAATNFRVSVELIRSILERVEREPPA